MAEGARTLEIVYQEAQTSQVSMPIVKSLYNILYKGVKSEQLLEDLLDHPHEVDVEFTQ